MAQTTEKSTGKKIAKVIFWIFIVYIAYMGIKNGIYRAQTGRPAGEQTATVVTRTPEQKAEIKAMGKATGVIYRVLYAYDQVCTRNGHPLTNFKKVYKDKYKDNLTALEKKFEKYDDSLENAIKALESTYYDRLYDQADSELQELRRALILEKLSHELKKSVTDIEWDNAFYRNFSMQETCAFFDSNAAAILAEETDDAKAIEQMQ